MKKILLGMLFALCFTNAFAGIDEGIDAGTKNLFIFGGTAYPHNIKINGVESEYGDLGPAFGAQFIYNSRDWFGLGLDFNYSKSGTKSTSSTDSTKSQMWTGMVMARINLWPQSGVRFYLPIGGGFGQAKISSSGSSNTSFEETDFALATGLGLDFDLNDMWIFGVEFRFTRIFVDKFGTNNVDNGFDYSNTFLRLGYKF